MERQMGNKTLIYILSGAVLFFLIIPLAGRQPLAWPDLFQLAKIMVLLAGYVLLNAAVKNAGQEKNVKPRIPELVMKLCVFVAGSISLNHGFAVFGYGLIWKALAFFTAGLALLFYFFSLIDEGGRQLAFGLPDYREVSSRDVSIKLAIACGLSLLGIYFIKKDIAILAISSFSAMLVQLYLVFGYKGAITGPQKEADAAGAMPGIQAGFLSVLMTALAFYLYYMALNALWLYDIRASMIYFCIGSLLFALAPAGTEYKNASPDDADFNKFDVIYCILIFFVSVAISSYKLMDIPPGIHGDETLSVKMAQRMISGEKLHVVLEPPEYNGMTLLLYWLIIMLGKIGGINIVTGRWLSVLVGALGPVFVYLIMKNMFSRRSGIMASLMLACFFMHVFYSRNCLQWIFVPALAAVSYYFFIKAMKNGNPLYFITAGAFVSINLCFYSAAKASPFVIFAFLALMLLRKETRASLLANWKGIFLMLAAMALVFSPVIDYIIHYPKEYFTRMSSVSFLKGVPSNLLEFKALAGNMVKNIQMFMTESANGYCHNIPQKPFLEGFSAFAALLGVGFLFVTWKREASAFLILWLFFGLLPGFLSKLGPEDPYPARTVLSIPAVVIITALGVDRVLYKLESLWPKILKVITPVVAAFFVFWFCFNSLRDYFVVFNNDPHTQVYYKIGERIMSKKIIENKNELFRVTTRLGSNFYYNLMPGLDMSRVKNDDVSMLGLYKVYNEKKMDYGVIGEGIYYRTLPVYKEYFPNARVQTVWDYNFWMQDTESKIKYCYGWKYPDKVIELNKFMSWFYFYDSAVNYALMSLVDIPWTDIKETFSLDADIMTGGKKQDSARFYGSTFSYQKPFDAISIDGLLDVPAYGKYGFNLEGTAADIRIDGRQAAGYVELYEGLHRIKISAGKNTSFNAVLQWKKEGSAAFTPVPASSLVNSNKVFGLLATYSREKKTVYKILETSIDYRLYYELHRPPFREGAVPYADISWDGFIDMKENGVYEFMMDTLYDARIEIDGKTVYTREKGPDAAERIIKIPMEKGKKKIKITAYYHYISTIWGKGSTLRFMYRKPGHAEFGPVTYDMLSPF